MADSNDGYQAIVLRDVSGGMRTSVPPNDIEDNEFVECRNMEFNLAGELRSRPGCSQVSAASPSLGLKGVINNLKIEDPTRLAYDAESQLLFICETGATNAVYIVDIQDPEKPQFLGACKNAGLTYPTDAAKHGDYLLVADRWAGNVHVFDISDPGDPVWIRKYTDATYLDWLHQIIVYGDYLFCANANDGGHGALVVLDISDLGTSISESNKITSHSGGKWISVVPGTNRLYQTNGGTDELHIFNITNPAAISLVISFLDGTNLNNVGPVVADEYYVYMASSADNRLIILDATNEVSVTIVSTITDAARLYKLDQWIYKMGNVIVCPSNWKDTLTIVNVADQAAPQIIADINVPNRFDQLVDAVLLDRYLFTLSAGDDYLVCLKLEIPKPFKTIATAAYSNQFNFLRATPDNRWVCAYEHVPANPVIRIYDRKNPDEIKLVDWEEDLQASYFPTFTFDGVRDVCWNQTRTRLYAWCSLNAGGRGGLIVFSFNDATGKFAIVTDASDNPVVGDFTDGGGYGGCGFFLDDEGIPYVATQNGSGSAENLVIIRVADDVLTKTAVLNWPGNTSVKSQINDVDKVLYTTTGSKLGVFDISDPFHPTLATEISDIDSGDLILQPDRTVLWGVDPQPGGSTIAEWDVTDPLSPVKKHYQVFPLLVSTMDWPWYDADTKKLFLGSATDNAIYVINVGSFPYIQEYIYIDPTALANPYALHVKDGYLMSVDDGLVAIIHAAVDRSFRLLWELKQVPLDEAYAVRHYGQKLGCVGKTTDSFSLLDIKEPAAIVQLGFKVDNTKMNGAVDFDWFGSGQYVIVAATTYGGVVVYDVSNPLSITEKSYLTGGSLAGCNAVIVGPAGEFAYVSAPGYLNVIDLRDPDNITLVAALKNTTRYAALNGLAFLGEDRLCGLGTNYLNVWNLQLPFSPYLEGSLNDASLPAGRCDADTRYLYATSAAGNSVRIYDLVNPEAPVFDNEITGLTGALGIRYIPVDNVLWVAAPGANSLSLFDVEDPTAPVLLEDLVDADNLVNAKYIDAAGFDCYAPSSSKDRVTAFRITGLPFRNKLTSTVQLKNERGIDRLVVTEGNHVLAEVGSGVFEVINGALKIPTTSIWHWEILDGILFGIHGQSPVSIDEDGIETNLGYPQVVYWDGETSSLQEVQDFPEQSKACKALAVWNHRLFVQAGNGHFYSDLGDGTDFISTLAGSLEVFTSDGDETTGMIVHKGTLVVFKRKHIYRILPGVPNTDDSQWSQELVQQNTGAISGDSITAVLDDLLLLSSEGVTTLSAAETLGDFETTMISQKIKELRGLKLSPVSFPGIYWPKKSQFWLSVDSDGDGVLDTTWILDMKQSLDGNLRWSVFDGGMVGSCFAIIEKDDENLLYIGSDQLYKQDETVFQDAGTNFTKKILSKSFDADAPDFRKELLRFGVELVKRSATLTLTAKLYFDGSSSPQHTMTINADSISQGIPKLYMKMLTGLRRFKRVQFEISNSGNEAFELESLYMELATLTIARARDL